MPLLTVSLVLATMVIVTLIAMTMVWGHVVAGPVEEDVGDLEVVPAQHHHVGGAVERVGVQAVQLDVLRLGGSHTGRPSSIDRYLPARIRVRFTNRAVGAHRASARIVPLQ